jgi:hypothetical protein
VDNEPPSGRVETKGVAMNANDNLKDIVERLPKDLYVGGSWRPAQEGRTFDVEDPSTGEVLCAVADATPADGLMALDAAAKAQDLWVQHPHESAARSCGSPMS